MKFFRLPETPPFNDLVVGDYRAYGVKLSMTRGQVLLIQLSKLLNYFPDRVERAWGGGLAPLTLQELEAARHAFESEVMSARDAPCWLYRKDATKLWGPDNWQLKDKPNGEFGLPFEPYIACNGGILCLNQAKRFLGVDIPRLIRLKSHLLLDELVIAQCVRDMLRPQPLWSELVEPPGAKQTKPKH